MFSQKKIHTLLIPLEGKFSFPHLKTLSSICVTSFTSTIRNPIWVAGGPSLRPQGDPSSPCQWPSHEAKSGFHTPEHGIPGRSVSGQLSDGF